MIKIKDLKKWPKDWDQHIIQSCQLYFDNKTINFINYNETYMSITFVPYPDDTRIQVIKLDLEFEYNGKEYIIYLTYKNPCFSLHCYYKDFRILAEALDNPVLASSILCNDLSFNDFGIYYLNLIAGQSSFNETPYDIIKVIKNIILNHNKGNDNDGGEDDEQQQPSPDEPIEQLDLEPLLSF